jgi:hypothetical protein
MLRPRCSTPSDPRLTTFRVSLLSGFADDTPFGFLLGSLPMCCFADCLASLRYSGKDASLGSLMMLHSVLFGLLFGPLLR